MRAVSRTTLSLGDFLAIPVGIVAATGSADLKLSAGYRQGTEPEVEEVPAEALEAAEPEQPEAEEPEADDEPGPVPVQGVKVGDELREIPASELEWAKAVTTLDTVKVLESINYRRVPTDRLAGTYYVQPDPAFDGPCAVLMEAMHRRREALLVQFALKSRQRLGVIRARAASSQPGDDRLVFVLNLVVYADEWRKPDARVLAPHVARKDVNERAVERAIDLLAELHGTGEALATTRDGLLVEMEQLAERAIDGVYEDPEKVAELAASLAEKYPERSERLTEYAASRWPQPGEVVAEPAEVATPDATPAA